MSIQSVLKNCCIDGIVQNIFKEDEDEADNTSPSKPNAGFKIISGKLTKFEDMEWSKLPKSAKNAAKKLGFDQDGWDNEGWPSCEENWWEDLTPDEQKAAQDLGWDIHAWDGKYDVDWESLPVDIRKCAKSIGFTPELWGEDEWPDALYKSWEDLSAKQKRGLHALGYAYEWEWD